VSTFSVNFAATLEVLMAQVEEVKASGGDVVGHKCPSCGALKPTVEEADRCLKSHVVLTEVGSAEPASGILTED
jgi:hypothetical protein